MRFARLVALAALVLSFVTSGFAPLGFAQVEAAKPWLGVAIDQGDKGVLVTGVLADTPAASAGLLKDDQITAIESTRVKTPEELIRAVQAQGVGNTVAVHYLRKGQPTSVSVKLVARPDQLEMLKQKLVGKPVPPFELTVVHGDGAGKSADLKGKVVILEFWATWCPACLSTHERLSALAKARGKDGLVILAVSDEDEATLKAYAAKMKPDFTIVRDTTGNIQKDWMVSAIPMLAVIDRTGNVVHATIGAGTYLEETIKEAEKRL